MTKVFYIPQQQQRGGTGTKQESARKVNSGEEKSHATPADIQTHRLLIMSPALYQLGYHYKPHFIKMIFF